MAAVSLEPLQFSVTLLLGGGMALMLGVLGLGKLADNESPLLRIFAHWLPIAFVAVAGVILGRPELGISLVFTTSVAILSIVAGFLAFAQPLDPPPPESRAMWLFLPLVAALAFVGGFRATLTWIDALPLAGQGLLLLWVATAPAEGRIADAARPKRTYGELRLAAAIVLVAWLVVSAAVAAQGAVHLSDLKPEYPIEFNAAVVLTAVLALPMISTATGAFHHGRGWSVMNAHLGVVLLNVCLLLPLMVVLPLVFRTANPAPPAYPAAVWRVDAVALLVLSLLYVPIALGRVKLDRYVSAALVAAYCVYALMLVKSRAGG